MIIRPALTALATLIIASAIPAYAFPQEEVQYKKFKFENAEMHVGILYKDRPDGLDIGVSAIATGKGAEFRRWRITYLKLNIDGERIRPDRSDKFWTREESFFRVPAAVLFAVLGACTDVKGSTTEQVLGRAGLALGLGFIALQAKGDIPGERGIFNLDERHKKMIAEGRDTINIIAENEDLHLNESVTIGIVIPSAAKGPKYDFASMDREALSRLVNTLEARIKVLREQQASYKYGEDPKYDEMQARIEELQTEHGMAYNAWLEKG
jgi:hypothetical protein